MNAVVVGAGLAGLMAAKEMAGSCDADIKIINAGGGASPYVHGLNIPLDKRDSVSAFKDDTYKSGHCLNTPALVDLLCEKSLDIIELFEEYGIAINRNEKGYDLLKPLGSAFPRVACSGNSTGKRLLHCLHKELAENKKVEFLNNTRVLRIIKDGDKASGLLTYDLNEETFRFIGACCIVLATGGFCGIYPFSTNTEDIGGDGIAMAYYAGIELTDMEFIQFEPSVAPYPPKVKGKSVITTMFYDGAVLRNKNGQRFMLDVSEDAERVNKDILSKEIYKEISRGNGTPNGGVYFDATGVKKEILLKQYSSYVLRYSEVGVDISKELFEITPCPHTSLGGVKIDVHCKTNIKNIFAAGEVVGGLHGANRIGGNAGLETLVFGRRAGISAGSYVDRLTGGKQEDPVFFTSNIELSKNKSELDNARKRMESMLNDSLSVIRNGESLKKTAYELDNLLKSLNGQEFDADNYAVSFEDKSHEHLHYEKLRLINDLTCAYLLVLSAIERKGSVGCHTRSDSISEDSRYHVLIKKKGDSPVISKEMISGQAF